MRYRLLIVESSPRRLGRMKSTLSTIDCVFEVVSDPATAIELSSMEAYDLVLIARRIGLTTGFDLCADLREQHSTISIFVLGDRAWNSDRLAAFKAGADDYMIDPFDAAEFRARIERLLLRFKFQRVEPVRSYAFGQLRVNFESSEILAPRTRIVLSDLENRLLRYFVENKGKVLSRPALLRHVWRYWAIPLTRTVDAHIARLRKKIEVDSKNPRIIVTVHGSGYRFDG